MTKKIQLQEAFKLAISMVLMYWFALAMNWDMPYYGALAILLISLDTAGASFRKGIFRIVGTVVGLFVGLLLLALFAQDRWLAMLFLSVYLLIIGYFLQDSRDSYAYYVAGFLPFLVWAHTYMKADTEFFRYAIFRWLETTSGIIIYTVISFLVWPRNAGDQLGPQEKILLEDLRQYFRFYRGKLRDQDTVGSDLLEEGSALRTKLQENFSRLMDTLEDAFADTPSVIDQKKAWVAFGRNIRIMVDALELWKESIDDCYRLNPEQFLPHIDQDLEILDKRVGAILDIWDMKGRGAGYTAGNDQDTVLLRPLDLELHVNINTVPLYDRAALMSFVQQLRVFDEASRKLLRTVRVLAGLDSKKELSSQGKESKLLHSAIWNPEKLTNALFPMVCFVSAYVFWIFFDPPTGPMLPAIAATIALALLLTPMDAVVMLKIILAVIFVVIAPIYFLIMPALSTGFGLLTLIFIFMFVFGYLGGKRPMLKFVPILLFVMMTGISNNQVYSFIQLADTAIMFTLAMVIIVAVELLLVNKQPEKVFVRSVRRFFYGCKKVANEIALPAEEDLERGDKARISYLKSMLLPMPHQMESAEKKVDYKLFSENEREKAKRLIENFRSITLRFITFEISHERLSHHFPELMDSLIPMMDHLKCRLKTTFRVWSSFEQTDEFEGKLSIFEELSGDLKKQLDSFKGAEEKEFHDSEALQEVYTLFGSMRGLIEVLDSTQKTITQIDWNQWTRGRF